MSDEKIGIVIPVYNEIRRMNYSYLNEISLIEDVYLLFVDDGSSDATVTTLKEWFHGYGNVGILGLPKNVGKANAIRFGWLKLLETNDNSVLGFLDVDGAFEISDIKRCISRSEELFVSQETSLTHTSVFDTLWTSRIQLSGRNIIRSRKRFLLGRTLAKILGLLFDGLPWDTQSGMKFFQRNQSFIHVTSSSFRNRWLFEIEMHLRLKELNRIGLRIWEEPLDRWEDIGGSKVNFREQMRIIKEVADLFYRFRIKKGNG